MGDLSDRRRHARFAQSHIIGLVAATSLFLPLSVDSYFGRLVV